MQRNQFGRPKEWIHLDFTSDESGEDCGVFVDGTVVRVASEGDRQAVALLPAMCI